MSKPPASGTSGFSGFWAGSRALGLMSVIRPSKVWGSKVKKLQGMTSLRYEE